MTSSLQQYIPGYTVANLWRYPIRRHVASALEIIVIVPLIDFSLCDVLNKNNLWKISTEDEFEK